MASLVNTRERVVAVLSHLPAHVAIIDLDVGIARGTEGRALAVIDS